MLFACPYHPTGAEPTVSAVLHSAFYRFFACHDPAALAERLRGLAAGLQGSVVVAVEGVNGTVAGAADAVAAFEAALQADDIQAGALRGMAFKHSACTTPPFGRLKVSVKPEIVALGLPGAAGLPAPDEGDDSHVSPAAWRELLQRDDVVLLDNRNHFEVRLGRFQGAVDPQVHNFRDFVAHVQAQAPAWRAAGRTVAMYCTGGIRCDKTAPWLRSLGLDVKQLQGGILNHFAQLPHLPHLPHRAKDARHDWVGECYVFDRRVALDTRLQETATTVAQVYDPRHPDEAWRLRRAQQLDVVASPEVRPDVPRDSRCDSQPDGQCASQCISQRDGQPDRRPTP